MAAAEREPLTDQQRLAITARGVSVALSAGAGCGKTFVLTRRFLAQLDPAANKPGRSRLSQLVAITFTERAAREMRDRIRAACAKRLLECPEDQVDHWCELLRELDTARISTIHSFCGALLRSHAVDARLDPHFRVLDQAQADTLLYELLDDYLRNKLAEREEATIELVVQFGLEPLRRMIATLLGRRQEIDWSQWRNETADALATRWAEYWQSDTLPNALRQISQSPAAQQVIEVARRGLSRHPTMRQRCAFLVERLPRLPQTADPAADLAAIRAAAMVKGGGSKKDWESDAVYAEFTAAAKDLRDAIDGLQVPLGFDAVAARPAAVASLRLLGLADGLSAAYQQRKDELAVLDFNDLLIHARDLLAGPERAGLRKRLSGQIRLLLVDEFQDTDPLQVELVEALCDDELLGGKLFFVGDYKQSVYRFRGADPRVFRRLRERIPAEGRLPLSLNFRSQPAILSFINALFCESLGPDYEPLRPHRPQVAPTPAVEFLWATEEEPQSGAGAAERLRRREADWIARRIRALLDAGEKIVWDQQAAEAGRPAVRAVRPGDVALLFRALSDVELYEEALRRYDINYYLVGGHAFYSQQEIYDLSNLLRAINDPSDEVSLAGVLRSPMFSLLDETLFWLAQQQGGLTAGLTAGLLATSPLSRAGRGAGGEGMPLTPEQRRRVEFAAATLRDLRAMKDRLPIAQLIGEALARTGYDAVLLAEFLGQRKLANLRKLIEQARSFDRSGIFTLADFITQLSQFVVRQPDEALAATYPESADVVRLMTIHQAKGLEFPVVVVPDVDRARRGLSASVAFTRQLGPMVRDANAPSGFDLHRLAEDEEEQAELVRLLYVATTRAADYLILSAGVPEPGSARGPWTRLINRRFDPLSGRMRVVVPDGHPTPEITVTTTEPPLGSRPSGGPVRRDLRKIVDKARQMAADGGGSLPEGLGPVPPEAAARRQYSFSRLSGKLRGPQLVVQPGGLSQFSSDSGGLSQFSSDENGTVPFADLPAEPPLDPRGLGTLVHAVLAEVDFGNPGDVAAAVRRHAPRHLPDVNDGLDEPIEMIGRFLASARAREMAGARHVHAELEFLLAWPPGAPQPDGRYLQGFIDCLYQDAAGAWRLVDYKTNRVTAADVEREAAQYEMQMLLYGLAVERTVKCPPAELVLCFLRPGVEHHFSWNDSVRQRAVDLVNQALST